MFLRVRRNKQVKTVARIGLLFGLLSGVSVSGQTAFDLSAKYPAVSAYEVRPGVLMTAKYAVNGQVCEMTLQRHYSPNQPDADTTIPTKQERELIDELAPESGRGPESKDLRWRGFTAGGVSHVERDFVNVLVVIDGTYWCTDEPGGKANCGHGGTKVITIQWKNRTCADAKPKASIPVGRDGVFEAGKAGQSKGEAEAGKTVAGGSPEGHGLSALSGEKFLPVDNLEGQGTRNPAEVRGQDKIRGTGAQSGSKATASERTGDAASKSADALNRR